ncbi:RNA methyltransferase [Erysipelothrix urinaevulpis]|uniref:TrmH family RNA methyltransferase n=1 Tax=Erysipelothrix urinaevulpis TaxID=2683717 RepID=UPI00135B5754|nr:RNA methyltransferase [Erysipelothrix urinaevulpis]
MITSVKNDFVKHLVKLKQKKYRDLHQEFLVEGEHLIQELKKSSYKYQVIGLDASCDIQVSETVCKKISDSTSGSTLFALVKMKQDVKTISSRHILIDGVQDPGNIGTMIRTAHSFGFDAIYLSNNSADHLSPKAIRSSQGAVFHIPVIRGDLREIIQALKKEKIKVYVTNLSSDSVPLESLRVEPVAIVMGSEGQGVSQEILTYADQEIIIEMNAFDSLNVAIAQGIICHYFRKK